ncbi:phosphodiester glycosidase family protein [Actinomadura opuntiae]|uniref:phosphodiester glycosidase family protein n=1 Tax=Actinomadura sp. OS1-43 TaxID=604315 RepID=UPI00255A78FD|nr:phosphodiester glycosidase family protein [Actinomadura sp. OS1-43]MDL4819697.1 phosphodiester glycosidase family protein [Actinomadura sp. OS1-43]
MGRKWTAAIAAASALAVLAGTLPAGAAPVPPAADGAGSGEGSGARAMAQRSAAVAGLRYTSVARLSPGIVARTFETSGIGGKAVGDLLDIDLRAPHVRVGLLHPDAIAQRATVSDMANAQHAVAGINGDFFNISETHPGVQPTGSSSGPEVDGGRALKAAVPDGQRFGPALPPGTSTRDVIGVGTDKRGHVASLRLAGTVRSRLGTLKLRGLNQYALPVGGVGAFTGEWGTVSRQRAVCGTDEVRNAPCSTDTAEVTVRRGVVTGVSDAVGGGAIPEDTTVLVGRDGGADALRKLRKGDRLKLRYRLAGKVRFRFAVGGFPILRRGEPLDGLDAAGPAPRTAAGVSRDGRHLYLAVVDGRSEASGGLTVAELASLLERAGASDGVNLDGGGSSTFVARGPGEPAATVRNAPSDGTERAVANGIGVFS